MKIGDIVKQGTRVIKLGKKMKQRTGTNIGIVIDIREMPVPRENETEYLKSMMTMLGRQVDVLWENGKLTKNFAENSLEIIIYNNNLAKDK